MPRQRSQEFADFVLDGKTRKFGSLVMCGNDVYSYNMKIAEICRPSKDIKFCNRKVSVTTSCHQGAVNVGHALLPAGWVLNYSSEDI